jgi:acetylornithine/succinyldiaminopimelate/putrescine aminotransferase
MKSRPDWSHREDVWLPALEFGARHHHAGENLSGGYVPCGAIVTRRAIYQKTFSRMDRCVVHSTTFGRNNLAMACGLAALEVIDQENLVENAAKWARCSWKNRCVDGETFFHQGSRGKGL